MAQKDKADSSAELLRRERAAHAYAARRVAGPAPPRSWRENVATSGGRDDPDHSEDTKSSVREASVDELLAAEAFLGYGPRRRDRAATGTAADGREGGGIGGGGGGTGAELGAPSLVDVCLGLTLRLLRDETVVWDGEGEGEDGDEEGIGAVTMREAMLAGAVELDLHLRAGLLETSALLPPDSGLRLSDGDVRVLLEYQEPPPTVAGKALTDANGIETGSPPVPTSAASAQADEDEAEDDEWDTDPSARPTLPHLALTAHPAPLRLLRDVPRFSALALTSLDLAFAVLPGLERVVGVLPAGLRGLGLAGVRAAKGRAGGVGGGGYDGWERGLGSLARKMIVLQVSQPSCRG